MAHANRFPVKDALDFAFLTFPILKEHQNRNAGSLSGGQQQILSIARALSLNPKIMLLDEPSEGIQPSIVDEISKALNELSIKRQMSLIIAEQNIDFCMSVADRALIMDQGTIIKSFTKEELNEDKAILKDLLAI